MTNAAAVIAAKILRQRVKKLTSRPSKIPEGKMDRRHVVKALLGTTAALWTAPDAYALGLPKDKIKRIRYYKTPTDAAGRPNIHQPTFNPPTNIVTIDTESGLIGVGEC